MAVVEVDIKRAVPEEEMAVASSKVCLAANSSWHDASSALARISVRSYATSMRVCLSAVAAAAILLSCACKKAAAARRRQARLLLSHWLMLPT